MHRRSFKNLKNKYVNVDDELFNAMYKERLDDHLGVEAEISFLKQPETIDILLTNLYYPNLRQGTREQNDQQAVFSLTKENAKKLRDYLNKVL